LLACGKQATETLRHGGGELLGTSAGG
jgi:hypothetical protein